MTILDEPLARLDGTPATLGEIIGGRAALVVNVASQCGYTPQYLGLEALHEQYADRGFTVVGVPCNQFGRQEPGTSEEIAEFCSAKYGVTFPLTEKVDVIGESRHPVYAELLRLSEQEGAARDIAWNFEKFVLTPDGAPVARFSSEIELDDPALLAAVESALPR